MCIRDSSYPSQFSLSGTLDPGDYSMLVYTSSSGTGTTPDNGEFELDFEVQCEFERGDINRDGNIDLLDVGTFVNILSSSQFQCEADINADGTVDLLDVTPMVELLSGG